MFLFYLLMPSFKYLVYLIIQQALINIIQLNEAAKHENLFIA